MNEAIERIYKLTVQADQAVAQMKKAGNAAEDIQKQFNTAGTALKALFAGVSVAAVIQGFRSITEEADNIGKAAQKFGLATDSLQTLGYAAGQSGVDFDTMAKALQNLNKQLVDVDKGTDTAAKALRALGVSGADSPEEAFRKIAEGLSQIPAGAEKTAAALAIFGKAGADLIPLLDEGAAGLKKLEDELKSMGGVLSDATIEASTNFNDALGKIEKSTRAIAANIVSGMLPVVTDLTVAMADSAKSGKQWADIGADIATVLKAIAVVGVNVAYVFTAVGREIGGIAAQAAALAHLDFAAFGNIREMMVKDAEDARKNVDALTDTINNLGTGLAKVADGAKKSDPALEKLSAEAEALRKKLAEALATADKVAKVKPAKAEKVDKTPLERFVENAQKAQVEADLLIPKLDALQALFFQGKIEADTFEKLKEGLIGTGEAANEALSPMEAFAQSLKDQQAEADLWLEKLEKIEELHNSGAIGADVYADALKGIGVGMKEMSDKEAVDGVKEMNQAIANGLGQGVSGLVDMIFDANQSWEEFAASFLKSIAKMITELAIMQALKSSSTFGSFFASAHGNAFAGATGLPQGVYPAGHPMYFPMGAGNGPLTRFAHGGTIGVLAEGNNAEAIVPLMRHGGDLGVKASPVNIVVNNTMADSANVEVAETNKPDGSKQISLTIRKEIRAAMSDGSMDATMRGNFGLSRKAVR